MYIHYGASNYDQTKFKKIGYDHPLGTKPSGGLWGTWDTAKYSWKQWCLDNEFKENQLASYFRFGLVDNVRILELSEIDDLDSIQVLEKRKFHIGLYPTTIHIDWYELMKNYDVVRLNYSQNEQLWYRVLYGWDCDSILVLNENVIVTEWR